MTWYDSNWKQRKPIAIDSSATGDGSTTNKDFEVQIPIDWDLFWDNIRSDFFDVIVADVEGTILSFARKAGANYANRTLTLQIDDLLVKTLSVNQVYVYFQNPDQSADLAVSVTIVAPLTGYIDLSRPSGLLVSQPLQRPATTEPQTAFVKSSTDKLDIYFAVGNLFNIRANPYNSRLILEDVLYINVFSLDSGGNNETGRYDETKTRFIDGFVRVRTIAGNDNNDYALICRVVTSEEQQIDIRCLVQVRDQLPS
jgi:hypothetical protein